MQKAKTGFGLDVVLTGEGAKRRKPNTDIVVGRGAEAAGMQGRRSGTRKAEIGIRICL